MPTEYVDVKLPTYTGIVNRKTAISEFIWHAASVHRRWEIQNGADPKQRSPDGMTLSAIALAHLRWLKKHPECKNMLFEAVATVERLSLAGEEIPPCISAFLSTVYQDLCVIIRTEIWSYSGNNM